MPRLALIATVIACALVSAACGARRLALPTDSGTPLSDAAAIHAQVSSACSGVRTFTTELSLSGRAGDERLRGRVLAGFERPASMRLEGVAPFGAPAFILVAREATATLLLPRDEAVVRGARAEEILGALTGVSLGPADLQAVLTGCVSPSPRPLAGHLHNGGWASIDLEDGVRLFLTRRDDAWQVRAARRSGWEIEYSSWSSRFPATVRLRSTTRVAVDLTATLSQVEANVDLDRAAFTVDVPPDARPVTVEDLRDAGPLRSQ